MNTANQLSHGAFVGYGYIEQKIQRKIENMLFTHKNETPDYIASKRKKPAENIHRDATCNQLNISYYSNDIHILDVVNKKFFNQNSQQNTIHR